ncbi:MAG: translation elongation factor Ts [Buchnera aphidicola (Chaetogeoica yunlongensis)]
MVKEITLTLIKELRARTGVGVIDCKRALVFCKGNIEKAIDFLRKMGQVKAENKQFISTKCGLIFVSSNDQYGIIMELNCETDFVAKSLEFISFGKKILDYSLTGNICDVNLIKKYFEDLRIDLIMKMNENIVISRINVLKGKYITHYLHGNRIGVLLRINIHNNVLGKKIAMHISASNPKYLKPDLIPKSIMEREYEIQLELAMKSKKPELILEKIIKGRMIKFANEISLLGQNFIFDPKKRISDLLLENNFDVISFIRFEIGEQY